MCEANVYVAADTERDGWLVVVCADHGWIGATWRLCPVVQAVIDHHRATVPAAV